MLNIVKFLGEKFFFWPIIATLSCLDIHSAQIIARTAEATRQVAGISEVSP